MRSMLTTVAGILCCCCAAASGQQAELILVPVGSTTIGPGQQITIEVFVDGIPGPQLLSVYQVQLDIVPLAGASGSIGLVDPITPDPDNTSIFVDRTRADWVFKAAADAGAVLLTGTNPDVLRIATTSFSNVAVTTPKYCGTYIVTPSAGAVGDFQARLVLVNPQFPDLKPTFLVDQDRLEIPFSVVPTSGLTLSIRNTVLNDNCINRDLAADGVTPFSTATATSAGPTLDASCDEGGGLSLEQDVWYEHVAQCNGVLTVSTCNDADFDTRLAVYGDASATCVCPTDNTFLEACNDAAAGCAGSTAEVSFSVVAGTCHTIRIGGVGTAAGTGNLTITCAPDLCGNAQPIALGSSVTGSTDNTGLNDSIGPDCGTGLPDSPGVWYSAIGVGGRMTASLCSGTSFDTRLTVFEGTCGALNCVADASDTCGSQESVDWCSTAGTQYLILVHGSGGASGDFTLEVTSQTCDDGNACTDDSCSAGSCESQNNFDDTQSCCAPSTRTLTAIDDGNPCTGDVCNPLTGAVSHAAVANGPSTACEDGFVCTFDQCMSGACVHTDIDTITCISDAGCPDDNQCVSNSCVCVGTRLELFSDPGALPVAGCFATGEFVDVRIELGPADVAFISDQDIIGAQFFLEYDPTTFAFVSMQPGAALGDGSPFVVEVRETVDPVAGTIDYLVGVALGGVGTRSPATVAVVTFQVVAECDGYVRFRPAGPNGESNIVAISGGGVLQPKLGNLPPVLINALPPVLSACPADISTVPDLRQVTAAVNFSVPTVSDSCDGAAPTVTCSPPSGASFAAGTTTVTCDTTDSCGATDLCSFDVTVSPPVLTVDIQLSSTVAIGPFDRCVTFELWDCDAVGGPESATVRRSVSFTNGSASGVTVGLPGGQWDCLSVRDELHTLRSTAADFTTSNGIDYSATFVGSRATGGHWMIGGNLNGDAFIDILDFAVFFPQYLSQASAGTPCAAGGADANINGDSVVDLLDLVFVSGNSLLANESMCCGLGGASSATDGPIMSISVAELEARGLGRLSGADINGDGMIDTDDIIALVQGGIPPVRDPAAPSAEKVSRRAGRRASQD